jgi:outer membrane protein assembly factor BamB
VGDSVYVTLGLEGPVAKLDAATGKTRMTFKGSELAEEFICHEKVLLVVKGDPRFWMEKAYDAVDGNVRKPLLEEPKIAKQIAAYAADTGALLWELKGEELKTLVPLSLCAQGKRLFFLDGKHLQCRHADDGRELWRTGFDTVGLFIRSYAPTVVVHDDVILCMDKRLCAFSTETGQQLWTGTGAIGFCSPGDLFVIEGKAWTNMSQRRPSVAAVAFDVHTGKATDRLPYPPNQHHHRCHRDRATEKYMLIGFSGVEVLNLKTGAIAPNQWVRGICQYGFMPANGYIYVPPDPCRCYSDVKVNGFVALAEKNSLDGVDLKPALERGPRYGLKRTDDGGAEPDSWPTYRGNAQRSGATVCSLPAKLTERWSVRVGKSITAASIADRKIYLADRDGYTVYCLDAGTGKEDWRFMACGPVDTPPTLAGGFCVFGCGDGSVYSLDAQAGELVWRFKSSGLERRIGTEDRLESPWPVSGAVLVVDGTVYFAAGRSSHLDGGIKLYGLDLENGTQKCFQELKSEEGKTAGALADILHARGASVGMRGAVFDRELNVQSGRTGGKGMLDPWFHRSGPQTSVGLRGGGAHVNTPYGPLKGTRGREPEKYNQTAGHPHQQYARYLEEEWFPRGAVIAGGRWSIQEDLQPRAMVLAGDSLCLAGWIDNFRIELRTGRPRGPRGPGERDAVLRIYSAKDGRRLAEHTLESEPVWQGAAVAYGKLFLSLQSGKLLCLGE